MNGGKRKEVFMVSSVSGTDSSSNIQQWIAQMAQKMKAADTDGTKGLSKAELSSIDTSGNTVGADFINALQQNFDKLDTNGDGQLSSADASNAVKSAHHGGRHHQMGPPPGMQIGNSDGTDSTQGLSKDDLSAIDTSNNSSKAGFVNYLSDNFDKIDSNSDGELSVAEVKASLTQGDSTTTAAATAATTGNSTSNTSSFGKNVNGLADYLMKQLASVYQNNSSAIESALNLTV